MILTLVFIPLLCLPFSQVSGQTSYANEFVDPDYILSRNFTSNTGAAQATITAWASRLAADGPWSVMNKKVTPPSGNKHDYMSWAPYWWPDCSSVGNTTALTDEEVWRTCPYMSRDGQFNPDVRFVNDVGAFQSMSDAVLYGAIAWSFEKTPSSARSQSTVRFIRAWFLDEATRMNPNLNYGQMQRGPTGQSGSHTGILDLKAMAKVASAILILRKGKCSDWTAELDDAMNAWSRQYITWLETADIAIEEALAENNHGTFYYNQLAAMKLIVNDLPGAISVTSTFFSKQYLSQIVSNGDQPLEAARTRPYHYRAYNLAAMITNARIEKYADPSSNVWNRASSQGGTIKRALDFAMTIPAATSNEASYASELYPNIAAVASVYGDSDGKYLSFLKAAQTNFYQEAHFLWNQGPWSAAVGVPTKSTDTSTPQSALTTSKPSPELESNAGISRRIATSLFPTLGVALLALLVNVLILV